MIPHITNEIQGYIHRGAEGYDIAIVEIGGTVGDIESLPFLEAARQMGLRAGRAGAAYIHLTLVPYIRSAGELKTNQRNIASKNYVKSKYFTRCLALSC